MKKNNEYKYFHCTITAHFQLWYWLSDIVDSKKAQLLSIDGIAIRSITEQDRADMHTREDAIFLFEILEHTPEDAKNIAEQIIEEALDAKENEEEDEDYDENEDDQELNE